MGLKFRASENLETRDTADKAIRMRFVSDMMKK